MKENKTQYGEFLKEREKTDLMFLAHLYELKYAINKKVDFGKKLNNKELDKMKELLDDFEFEVTLDISLRVREFKETIDELKKMNKKRKK